MPKRSETAGERLAQGPLLEFVGYHVRLAQLAVYADFMRGQPEPNLTPGQLAILILVHENPGTSQRVLAERIGVDKSTLTVILDRLADRKLLRRVRSKEDRRANVLELTAAGTRHMRRMIAFVRRHERRTFKNLSATEQRELLRLLGKVRGVG
jgi:DNA-binding MarR family transcriptional regulator